jgi:hypothetical protein
VWWKFRAFKVELFELAHVVGQREADVALRACKSVSQGRRDKDLPQAKRKKKAPASVKSGPVA